jgi:SCY1-like protein 2
MIPFVLPNVLLIAESCTNEEYDQLIFPKLKPVLKIQDPIQVQINTLRNVLWENTKSSINYLKMYIYMLLHAIHIEFRLY